jgi:hypothetical protein
VTAPQPRAARCRSDSVTPDSHWHVCHARSRVGVKRWGRKSYDCGTHGPRFTHWSYAGAFCVWETQHLSIVQPVSSELMGKMNALMPFVGVERSHAICLINCWVIRIRASRSANIDLRQVSMIQKIQHICAATAKGLLWAVSPKGTLALSHRQTQAGRTRSCCAHCQWNEKESRRSWGSRTRRVLYWRSARFSNCSR